MLGYFSSIAEIDFLSSSSKRANEYVAPIERASTSPSINAQGSAVNSDCQQTAGNLSLQNYQTGRSALSTERRLAHSNLVLKAANGDVHFQNVCNEEYAASVMTGANSLGIDIAPHVQQSFMDQHGHLSAWHYSHSTAERGLEYSEDALAEAQSPDLGPVSHQDAISLAYKDDERYLNYDLVGVGAQFQGQSTWK